MPSGRPGYQPRPDGAYGLPEYPQGYEGCTRQERAQGWNESKESQMATVALTNENFTEVVQDNDIVFVDFWAAWCGPCKAFAPVFEAASEEHPGIVFGKVDTEAEVELAGSFGIRSIPTLMIFRDEILVFSQPGAIPREALDDLIGQAEALDMDEVRRQVEDQQRTASAS